MRHEQYLDIQRSSSEWTRQNPQSRSLVRDAVREFCRYVRPNQTILEAGCGDGYSLDVMRELGLNHVIGCDINLEKLRIARGYGHVVALQDLHTLVFDAVFSTHTLEHAHDGYTVAKEFFRVLRPGGLLYIVVPDHEPLYGDTFIGPEDVIPLDRREPDHFERILEARQGFRAETPRNQFPFTLRLLIAVFLWGGFDIEWCGRVRRAGPELWLLARRRLIQDQPPEPLIRRSYGRRSVHAIVEQVRRSTFSKRLRAATRPLARVARRHAPRPVAAAVRTSSRGAVTGGYTDRQSKAEYVWHRYRSLLKGKVLDVGAGEQYLKPLLEGQAEYVGIGLGPAVDLRLDLEVQAIPFSDDSFDCVLCLDVLEHVDKLHDVFDELCRVTRKYVILSLPNPWHSFYKMLRWGDYGKGQRLKFYGLPKEPVEDRHKWFFSGEEAKDFVYYRAQVNHMKVVSLDEYGGGSSGGWFRCFTESLALRVLFRNRERIRELAGGTVWAVLERKTRRPVSTNRTGQTG